MAARETCLKQLTQRFGDSSSMQQHCCAADSACDSHRQMAAAAKGSRVRAVQLQQRKPSLRVGVDGSPRNLLEAAGAAAQRRHRCCLEWSRQQLQAAGCSIGRCRTTELSCCSPKNHSNLSSSCNLLEVAVAATVMLCKRKSMVHCSCIQSACILCCTAHACTINWPV
jgi:hypothetical protein